MKKRHRYRRRTRQLMKALRLHPDDIHCGCLGGFLLLFTAIFVRVLAGSPYRYYAVLAALGIDTLPSIAWITVIHMLLAFVMGFACGLILCDRAPALSGSKYRAGMLFVILSTLWLSVYPLLFCNCMPWIALIMLVAVFICSLFAVFLFGAIRRLCGIIVFVFSCWIFYLSLLVLRCLLRL